jgi:hypothetical protein
MNANDGEARPVGIDIVSELHEPRYFRHFDFETGFAMTFLFQGLRSA